MLAEGVVLCFDFGLARTGVAMGNTLTRIAKPLEILPSETNEVRWSGVQRLVQEWDPVFFVVGVPRHGDGTNSTLTARCERFARQLQGRYRRRTYLVDERYSSVAVEDGSGRIDDQAAAVILQQFFDEGPMDSAGDV